MKSQHRPVTLALVAAAASFSFLGAPLPAARAQNGDDLIEAAKKQLDKYQKKMKSQDEQEKQLRVALDKQGELLGRAETMLRGLQEGMKRAEGTLARQEELVARQNRLIDQQQRQLEQAQRMLESLRSSFGGRGGLGGPGGPGGAMMDAPHGGPAPLIPPTPPSSPIPPPRGGNPPPPPIPTPNPAETPKPPM